MFHCLLIERMDGRVRRPNTPRKSREQGMVWEAPAMGHCHRTMATVPSPSLRGSLGITDMTDSVPGQAPDCSNAACSLGAFGDTSPKSHSPGSLLPLDPILFPVARSLRPPFRSLASELMLTRHGGPGRGLLPKAVRGARVFGDHTGRKSGEVAGVRVSFRPQPPARPLALSPSGWPGHPYCPCLLV